MACAARRVALAVNSSWAANRRIIRGVAQYVTEHNNWALHWGPGPFGSDVWLENWEGDGIIAHIPTDLLAERYASFGVPVVNVSTWWDRCLAHPGVVQDDAAVGHTAAAHFLERGFRQCAYFGRPESHGSVVVGDAFAAAVEEAGYPCDYYPCGDTFMPWQEEVPRVREWLRSLPTPVGVLAPMDARAWVLNEVCRLLEIRIPEDVALVGVGNDQLVCDLCVPRLSSVDLPHQQIGYEAAALLARMMDGEVPPDEATRMAPTGVVTRRSSDVLALEDEEVAAAMRFIRAHASDPICVKDVMSAVPVSRRSLERRFRKEIGRTISAEIRRAHVDRAKRLLIETDLAMPEVAAGAGFQYAQRLSTVFRRETGQTPTQFRMTFRTGDGHP